MLLPPMPSSQWTSNKVISRTAHLQVVQLVPLLCKVHAPQVRTSPPEAECLVQVQDGDVGKVGDAGNSL